MELRQNPEWELLKLISVRSHRPEDPELSRLIADTRLDFESLVALGIRHALSGALSEFLRRSNLWAILPQGMANHMNDLRLWSKCKSDLHIQESLTLLQLFEEADLRVAFAKGVSLAADVYDGTTVRQFNDIDIMIDAADREPARLVLERAGYDWSSEVDWQTDSMIPRPRRESAVYRLYPDHFPHLFRPTGMDHLPFINVDVAFSVTWNRSVWQWPIEGVMSRLGSIEVTHRGSAVRLPKMSPVDAWIHLISHTFRDGFFVNPRKDLKLSQFADVNLFWEKYGFGMKEELTSIIDSERMGPLMGWVCSHTDDLFGSNIVDELRIRDFAEDEWKHTVRSDGGAYLVWSGSMDDRLQLGTVPSGQSVNQPKFAYNV